ncbi:MAG: hypothetical protein ACTH10_07995, partial [Lactococcus cremoris]
IFTLMRFENKLNILKRLYMALSDLISETLAGLENGLDRIDAGFAKQLHQMGKVNSDENTKLLSQQMLSNYFPKMKD